ncbi:MAG: cupin domain-containing protein [Gammaproteobacteria bacterium]|nr:cupin domain-containing protein [Gammaproteobacteria bacterium]NDA14879.1 cupin domain-containing protein [Gammaproteobacteria bacterium]NDG44289.1 cupin domain-containing protein [Gammaproteobacteria bacterium]
MLMKEKFFNLDDLTQGIRRELGPGVTTRIFPGDHAMLSVVRIEAHAQSDLHAHEQEQWGVLLRGSGTRIQGGEEFEVKEGDFWRTPPNVPHAFRAGSNGVTVLDVFSPPREEYRVGGTGIHSPQSAD